MNLTLTEAEVNHIRSLLNRNLETGEYYGNQSHYWDRHFRIYDKLNQLIK